MTSDTQPITIDPEATGAATLPDAPESGLVLAIVPPESADVCAWHLLDFARRWRDAGRRVVLWDACVDAPILHHAADVENGEGVSDAILYGTSFDRVVVPLEQNVALAPAGTVVGASERVLTHVRWSTVASRYGADDDLLVVAVPEEAEVELLADLAGRVVRFGPDEGDGAAATESSDTTPADAPSSTHATDAPGPVPASSSSSAGASASARSGARDAESSGRGGRLFVLLLLLVVVVLGAAWLGLIEIPGVTPMDVSASSPLL